MDFGLILYNAGLPVSVAKGPNFSAAEHERGRKGQENLHCDYLKKKKICTIILSSGSKFDVGLFAGGRVF
jgi:hypothetical protein